MELSINVRVMRQPLTASPVCDVGVEYDGPPEHRESVVRLAGEFAEAFLLAAGVKPAEAAFAIAATDEVPA